jgi:hypothetical protein
MVNQFWYEVTLDLFGKKFKGPLRMNPLHTKSILIVKLVFHQYWFSVVTGSQHWWPFVDIVRDHFRSTLWVLNQNWFLVINIDSLLTVYKLYVESILMHRGDRKSTFLVHCQHCQKFQGPSMINPLHTKSKLIWKVWPLDANQKWFSIRGF